MLYVMHYLVCGWRSAPHASITMDTANIVAAYLDFEKQWTTGGTLLVV